MKFLIMNLLNSGNSKHWSDFYQVINSIRCKSQAIPELVQNSSYLHDRKIQKFIDLFLNTSFPNIKFGKIF